MKTNFFRAYETVEYYDLLKDYNWVDGFLKIPDVQKNISELNIEHRRIEALPPLKAEFYKKLEADFKKIQQARTDWLYKYFIEGMDSSKPLEFYSMRAKHPIAGANFAPYVSWDEIKNAFNSIVEGPGAISAQKKEQLLLGVDKKLAGLKVEIGLLSPQKFFLKKGGRIIGDARKRFIMAWQDLQATISEPCNPLSYTLAKSSKPEQAAWDTLCLFQDVNPNGKYVPDPGDK